MAAGDYVDGGGGDDGGGGAGGGGGGGAGGNAPARVWCCVSFGVPRSRHKWSRCQLGRGSRPVGRCGSTEAKKRIRYLGGRAVAVTVTVTAACEGGEAVMVEEAGWEGGGVRSVCLGALLVKNMSGAAPAGAGRCLAGSLAPVSD